MPQLILHAGLHKTGTSTLQSFLALNAALLTRHGFHYPAIGRAGTATHHNLAYELINEGVAPAPAEDPGPGNRKGLGRARRLARIASMHRPEAGTFRDLVEWMHTVEGATIISSEAFGRFNRLQLVKLRELIGPIPLHVVIYLRPQAELIQSAYFQQAKVGVFLKDFGTFFDKTLSAGRLQFFDMVDKWRTAKAERITPRVLERARLVNGELIDDFMTAIGAEAVLRDPALVRPANVNVSPGPRTLAVCQSAYRLLGGKEKASPDDIAILNRVQRAAASLGWDQARTNLLGPKKLARVNATCDAQNRRLATEYFGRADGKLFDREPAPGADRLPLLEEIPHEDLLALLLETLKGALPKARPKEPRA